MAKKVRQDDEASKGEGEAEAEVRRAVNRVLRALASVGAAAATPRLALQAIASIGLAVDPQVLRFAWLGRERHFADERKRLDPDDPAAILDRIWRLAQRLEGSALNGERAFAPGIEVLARVAMDLRLLRPPYMAASAPWASAKRQDVRERHTEAVRAVKAWSDEYEAHCLLEEAARLWRTPDDDRTEADIDREAVNIAKRCKLLRRKGDRAILRAIGVYREKAEIHRSAVITYERVEALAGLIRGQCSAEESAKRIDALEKLLKRHRTADKARVRALTGRG